MTSWASNLIGIIMTHPLASTKLEYMALQRADRKTSNKKRFYRGVSTPVKAS
jgi:hypothetical protein